MTCSKLIFVRFANQRKLTTFPLWPNNNHKLFWGNKWTGAIENFLNACVIIIARFEGWWPFASYVILTITFNCRSVFHPVVKKVVISRMPYEWTESLISPAKQMTTIKSWTDSMKEFDKTAVTRTLGTFAKLIMGRICGK